MFYFASQLIKTDVTSITITENHILTGIGDSLFIFNARNKHEFVQKIKIFDGHKIHGISPHPDGRLLVHGACKFSVLSDNLEIISETDVSDWILCTKWLRSGEIALVSMHNVLFICAENFKVRRKIYSAEKCILYSALICNDTLDSLVVLSGTVFSEILLWKPSTNDDKPSPALYKLQGHKGVIFCLDYDSKSGVIASSSDDRSTILWEIQNGEIDIELRQENPQILFKVKVFGHVSRVFRCKIIDERLITAGEDSVINLWNFQGQLLRKFDSGGGCVWALDSDGLQIVSGGGNTGITIFPLDNKISEFALIEQDFLNDAPKNLGVLASNNLVILTDSGILFYYVVSSGQCLKINHHDDLASYNLLQTSDCRRLVALAGFQGQIYIYQEFNRQKFRFITKYEICSKSRIYSLHWLTCGSFITCENNGILSLFYLQAQEKKIQLITQFILPPGKERVSTSACLIGKTGQIIIGDRKGHVYVYKYPKSDPVQIFKRVQTHLGVTHLSNKFHGDKITVMGRSGNLKIFAHNRGILSAISSDKLPFNWQARVQDNFIIGFSGDHFVLFDHTARRVLFDYSCGGGHRSWDFFISAGVNFCFAYIKDGAVKIVVGDKSVLPTDLVQGYHSTEINSLKCVSENDCFLTISGGEDTNLRLSLIGADKFENIANFKSHLSSIRSVCVLEISVDISLIFSAGGRGQIICWLLKNREISEESSFYESEDDKSETRVMDLQAVKRDRLLLFAACSDGNIKKFEIAQVRGKFQIIHEKSLFCRLKCVSRVLNFGAFLISFSTDGNAAFWNISDSDSPFDVLKIHQSGINACFIKALDDGSFVLLTGGDDNCITLNLLKITRNDSGLFVLSRLSEFNDVGSHCAQITGVYMTDCYFLTTGIDQILILHKWALENGRFKCETVCRYNSAVPDIHGFECFENGANFSVILYGKGVDYVKVFKK